MLTCARRRGTARWAAGRRTNPNPNPNPDPDPNPSPNFNPSPNQVGSWTAPFAMAQINTRVVYAAVAPARTPRLAAGPRQAHCSRLSLGLDRRRSVGLLAEAAPAAAARLYSADFTYSERATAPDEARATKMARDSNPTPTPTPTPTPNPNPNQTWLEAWEQVAHHGRARLGDIARYSEI